MIKIKTSSGKWEYFCKQIENFLKADTIELSIEDQQIRGFRSPDSPALWIRDHSDIMRGGKYFEKDVKNAVDIFAKMQGTNGRIFDHVITSPEKKEAENWEKWVRVQVEADVEYRFVKAAYLGWQASGDTDWIIKLLPNLDLALTYCLTHPWRWDEQHQLLKRPYTIDTWDFDYTAGKANWLNFQITKDTFWGIFHGDNSGFYESSILLSNMYKIAGDRNKAESWKTVAVSLKERANKLLFNGDFYTHFHKITPVTIDGVNEKKQLSLSTPMAINRGLATHEIAIAIFKEYQKRKKEKDTFAEWFGIDPPFPDGIFGDDKLIAGAYINGGIFPLTGGELSKAAFDHGFEEYGLQTLEQYRKMIAETNETYLWYFPDGSPSTEETSTSPDAMPTDGWGSSAMLVAFIEGLCGIEDLGHSFKKVKCSPKWAITDEKEININITYAASSKGFGYSFKHEKEKSKIKLNVEGKNSEMDFHILLPENSKAISVNFDRIPIEFQQIQIEKSNYIDFPKTVKKEVEIEIEYKME